jgi:hypothetical protein
MATLHGASALALNPGLFIFEPGRTLAGLVAVELPPGDVGGSPLARALRTGKPPRLLFPAN